jgi:hypothetical protein
MTLKSPQPPLAKGRCEKIEMGDENASIVVQGTGKFALPKSAGKENS